jgi:biopolymer transport protein ExbB/TolQ
VRLILTAFDAAPVATVALALLALAALGVAIDRAIVVARSRLSGHGRPFIERLVALVESGSIDEALAACSRTQAILPDIGLIVLRTRLREPGDLQAVTDAAVLSTTPKLSRRLRYLPALATAAVLTGAAGTAASLTERPAGAAIAWETLAPLALGLFVAAPIVAAHAFLAHQIDAILAQVGEFAHRLVNALLDRPDVRLGHR